jgi:hypothetical protein
MRLHLFNASCIMFHFCPATKDLLALPQDLDSMSSSIRRITLCLAFLKQMHAVRSAPVGRHHGERFEHALQSFCALQTFLAFIKNNCLEDLSFRFVQVESNITRDFFTRECLALLVRPFPPSFSALKRA